MSHSAAENLQKNPQSPAFLTATEALARLRTRELTAEALTLACLAQVKERDPLVKAWSFIDPEHVLAQARELDRIAANGNMGPLHGLPIGIKDVILTEDMPTQYNSQIYQGFHPRIDAACVSILRAAGALIFGKADTVEFAAAGGRKALTHNPRDLERTPGASSSGSAAAVADFHVPLALGTQTGGSMIRPASFCGAYAIKPTWNLVNRDGAKVYAVSLDTIGWFGRSVADLALLYEVFVPEKVSVAPLDLSKARIAICRSPVWDKADPATKNALATASQKLKAAGAQVIDLELPSPFEKLVALQYLIMRTEGGSAFLAEYRKHYEQLHQSFRDHVDNTDGTTRDQLRRAYDISAECRARFDEIAAGFDAILTPSAVGEAPVGLAFTGDYVFNAMWTLLHVPCVNIPCFNGPNGLPVGLTVTGPRFSDPQVLVAAEALSALFLGAA